jgi:acyl carrier protein
MFRSRPPAGGLRRAVRPRRRTRRSKVPHHAVTVEGSTALTSLERELAALIVAALRLEITADEIDPAVPLYGDALGLDSIDMLEIALAVSKQYGFDIRSDNVENERIFASLRELASYVAKHRTR